MPSLTANGCRFWYEVTGSGAPLVLLHGLGSSTLDWSDQVEHFARRYRVITWDARGHGRSDRPRGRYGIATFRNDAAACIEALDAAPAHVVGLSLGGMVAFDLALHRPELLQSLTVVNCGPRFPLAGLAGAWWKWQRLLVVRLLGMHAMGAQIAGQVFPRDDQAPLRTRLVERWSRNDPRAYAASLAALPGWSIESRLAEIRTPTLVLTADADYTSVAWKRAWAARLADVRLEVIPGTRHMLPFEDPAAFNAALDSFLDSLRARHSSA